VSLKHARKAKGLTLAEVAERTGLLDEAIARAEREGTDPRFSTVTKIAAALGVPLCELVEGTPKHEHRAKKRR
jgi:transcriptional regulator with XRE-family HTH domain